MTSRPSGFQLTGGGRLKLYSTRELFELPAPEWLIDGILPRGGVVGLYGPPGEGKSFVALDMAVAIATGLPWQGNAVHAGYVLYIAAEGGVGITKRVKALAIKHHLTPDAINVAWLTEAVSVNNDVDDIDTLFNRLDNEVEDQPVFIVIDTLARCFDGNENEQEDMGRFIAGVDRMRLHFNATVMIIHHTNVSGERERGNTAFRGAADTMVSVKRDKDTGNILVACNKQKDAVDFDTIELMLQVIPEVESAVVVQASSVKATIVYDWIAVGPLRYRDLRERAEEEGSGVSVATLKRKLRELQQEHRIVKNIEGFYETVDTTGSGSHTD